LLHITGTDMLTVFETLNAVRHYRQGGP